MYTYEEGRQSYFLFVLATHAQLLHPPLQYPLRRNEIRIVYLIITVLLYTLSNCPQTSKIPSHHPKSFHTLFPPYCILRILEHATIPFPLLHPKRPNPRFHPRDPDLILLLAVLSFGPTNIISTAAVHSVHSVHSVQPFPPPLGEFLLRLIGDLAPKIYFCICREKTARDF